jgi:thymidylate synthase
MNKLDKDYLALCQDILDNGTKKETRNGDTISVFGRQIRHSMKDGFPLLTTKKIHFKSVVTELLWFLQGRTDLKWLLEQGNTIWVGDAYKNWCKQFEVDPNNFDGEEIAKGHNDQCWGYPILDHVKPTSKEYKRGQINAYLEGKAEKPFFYLTQEEFINKIKTDDEFAKQWGSLGKIYGAQWRSWTGYESNTKVNGVYDEYSIDQIANLINEIKTNPDSRRLLVSAWNVGELDQMILPPCHYGFQVYTRELSEDERYDLLTQQMTKLRAIRDEDYINYNIPTRAISLMWNQRSVDTGLGLPFNIASYGLLLEIIAKMVNMVPDELIGNLGDCHIYLNHIDGLKEQIGRKLTLDERIERMYEINEKDTKRLLNVTFPSHDLFDNLNVPKRTREPYPLPKLIFGKTDSFFKSLTEDLSLITHLDNTDFTLENYKSHPKINLPLSN